LAARRAAARCGECEPSDQAEAVEERGGVRARLAGLGEQLVVKRR
jgi:hypothetical protein